MHQFARLLVILRHLQHHHGRSTHRPAVVDSPEATDEDEPESRYYSL